MRPATTPRRQQTRDELFAAAQRLFSELGYGSVTHADIADTAGIGRTTFYEYFTSKEDLLVELVVESVPRLIDEIIAGVPDDVPADEQLAELAAQMIQFVATDEMLGLLLHREVLALAPGARERIRRAHDELARTLLHLYRRGVDQGLLRELPAMLVGRLIEEFIMAAGRTLMDLEDPKQHVHEVADAAVEFLMGGLRLR